MMEAKEAIKEAIKRAHEKKPGIVLPSADIYNAIFKAGRREVVEFLESHHCGLDTCDMEWQIWQTFKKERGIK